MPDLENDRPCFVVDTADVAESARLGEGVKVWHLAQVREDARIGADSIIGRSVYIDHSVELGSRCKIQNAAQIFSPARLGNGVFVGPGAILANDPYPRSVTPDGDLKHADDWDPIGVTVEDGATIGAGCVILGGVSIGRWAVVGAGAVVTRNVPSYALMVGTPARRIGWVGRSARRLTPDGERSFVDPETGDRFAERSGILEVTQ